MGRHSPADRASRKCCALEAQRVPLALRLCPTASSSPEQNIYAPEAELHVHLLLL